MPRTNGRISALRIRRNPPTGRRHRRCASAVGMSVAVRGCPNRRNRRRQLAHNSVCCCWTLGSGAGCRPAISPTWLASTRPRCSGGNGGSTPRGRLGGSRPTPAVFGPLQWRRAGGRPGDQLTLPHHPGDWPRRREVVQNNSQHDRQGHRQQHAAQPPAHAPKGQRQQDDQRAEVHRLPTQHRIDQIGTERGRRRATPPRQSAASPVPG